MREAVPDEVTTCDDISRDVGLSPLSALSPSMRFALRKNRALIPN